MGSDVDLNKKRKQVFFNLCSIIIIIAFLILLVIDWFENDIIEAWIDITVALTLFVSLYVHRKLDKDMMIYRAVVFIMILLYLFSVYLGFGEKTVLYWAYIFPLIFFYFFWIQRRVDMDLYLWIKLIHLDDIS